MTAYEDRAPAARVWAFAALAVALVLLTAGKPAWKRVTLPRTSGQIAQRMANGLHDEDCASCHTLHAGDEALAREHALTGPNDNTLCDGCHTTPWAGGSYGGTQLYDGSSHGSSPTMLWPGPYPPARTETGAARKCLNCHDPHGWEDKNGKIPFLAIAREEALCLTCHDGAHARSDIRTDVGKPFAHPSATTRGRHSGPGEAAPADFAISPINRRHAECEDCHNPHLARADDFASHAPEASKLLLGVSRVSVLNGAPGIRPGYVFLAASDTATAPFAEYQLCFKCHSSWTTQPSGQTDMAIAFNPANPSHHAVEARGADPGISPAAFATGWNAASVLRCGDCHGSDSGVSRGPHGSLYPTILARPYDASPQPRATTADELCFRCHQYAVYADPNGGQLPASRFNPPGDAKGHAGHVGASQVPCYACHVTHGSATQRHLIALGRNPGMVSYTETPTGGTCASTCHDPKSYTLNYGR
jgi:predicted CXXCH cytochrome family protein